MGRFVDVITRRTVLRAGVVAAGSAALAAHGCKSSRRSARDDQPASATPDAPTLPALLRGLLLAIGPWGPAHAATAESVLDRYLTDERIRGYAASERALSAISARFDHAPPPAMDQIELASFTPDERRALLALVDDLHAIHEVRFFIAGQPPPGACIGDLTWHTRAPRGL